MRMAHADQPRQAHRAAVDQRHAEAAAVDAEVRVLLHHAQVAPERQLHAAGHRGAADGGDHRLGQQQARRPHRAGGCASSGFEVQVASTRRRRPPAAPCCAPNCRSQPAQKWPLAPWKTATRACGVGVEGEEGFVQARAVSLSTALRTSAGPA
jgi:hypothetical protein